MGEPLGHPRADAFAPRPRVIMHLRQFQRAWTELVHPHLHALHLASEPEGLWTWDGQSALARWTCSGKLLLRRQLDFQPRRVSWSSDGRVMALADGQGRIEVMEIAAWKSLGAWRHEGQLAALQLDAFGHYLLVSTKDRTSVLYSVQGREWSRCSTARQLRHVHFLSAQPRWIGVAEQGLIVCVDAQGQIVWQDTTTSMLGNLAMTMDDRIWVAAYGQGLRCVQTSDGHAAFVPTPHAAFLVAASCANSQLWIVSEASLKQAANLALLHADGRVLASLNVPERPAMLKVSPLGDDLYLGWANGRVECWSMIKRQEKP